MIEKVKQVAHFTVAKTCDWMDAQRVRFQMRELLKQKEQLYIEVGKYLEKHASKFDDDEYLYRQFVLLRQLHKELEVIQDIHQDIDSVQICPACGGHIMGTLNFCPNCGSRVS